MGRHVRQVRETSIEKIRVLATHPNLSCVVYHRLEQYKLKHGDCLVPKRFKGDPKLGTWCDTQRVAYKKMKRKLAEVGTDSTTLASGTDRESRYAELHSERTVTGRLTDERIRRLEDIGFVWSVRDDWQSHFEQLKQVRVACVYSDLMFCVISHFVLRGQFKAAHGHCNVPARYNENRKLGIFVSAQRSQYKALQMVERDQSADAPRTSLTRERIRLLNDLGFSWTVRSQYLIGESWNQKLNELKLYREIHGHCNVPARYPENPGLGIWVRSGWQSFRARVSHSSHSCTCV